MTTTIERAIHALENNVGEMRVEGALNILRAALAAPAAAPSAKAKKPRLNSAAFMTALVAAANARKMTMRDVSMATGVNETTLSRMKGGERACDAASFSALATWAGLNPQDFYLPSTAPATTPAQPSWQDAPTVPGLWLCRYKGELSAIIFNAYEIEHFDAAEMGGYRWQFIPEDNQ